MSRKGGETWGIPVLGALDFASNFVEVSAAPAVNEASRKERRVGMV